jgi:hypothetical protein
MNQTLIPLLAAIAMLVAQPQAPAAAVTGEIGFTGVVQFDTTSLATAHQVSIWENSSGVQGFLTVSDVTGSYSGIALGTDATMHTPWIFTPSTSTPGLWSVGGFTFDLLSSTITLQNSSFLDIKGTGTVNGTPAAWAFSAQSANGQNQIHFTISANTVSVPDGGTTAMLLGIGLIAVAIVSRKFSVV